MRRIREWRKEDEMDELKACPFCGKNNGKIMYSDSRNWKWVHCDKCGADGPADLGESGAIEHWNTRPIEDDLRHQLDIATRALVE